MSLKLQVNVILVRYEVTVLLRRWTLYCNLRTTSFYRIVLLYCNSMLLIVYLDIARCDSCYHDGRPITNSELFNMKIVAAI